MDGGEKAFRHHPGASPSDLGGDAVALASDYGHAQPRSSEEPGGSLSAWPQQTSLVGAGSTWQEGAGILGSPSMPPGMNSGIMGHALLARQAALIQLQMMGRGTYNPGLLPPLGMGRGLLGHGLLGGGGLLSKAQLEQLEEMKAAGTIPVERTRALAEAQRQYGERTNHSGGFRRGSYSRSTHGDQAGGSSDGHAGSWEGRKRSDAEDEREYEKELLDRTDGNAVAASETSRASFGRQSDGGRGHIGRRDWLCLACGGSNFAHRTACYKCKVPKPSDHSVAAFSAMAASHRGPSSLPSSAAEERGASSSERATHVLMVRGLNEDASEELLHYEFSKHAPIKELRLIRDKLTQQCRGFAFVHFHSVADAKVALDATGGNLQLEKGGNTLRVVFAKYPLGPSPPAGGANSASIVELPQPAIEVEALDWAPKEYEPENPDQNQHVAEGQADGQQDGTWRALQDYEQAELNEVAAYERQLEQASQWEPAAYAPEGGIGAFEAGQPVDGAGWQEEQGVSAADWGVAAGSTEGAHPQVYPEEASAAALQSTEVSEGFDRDSERGRFSSHEHRRREESRGERRASHELGDGGKEHSPRRRNRRSRDREGRGQGREGGRGNRSRSPGREERQRRRSRSRDGNRKRSHSPSRSRSRGRERDRRRSWSRDGDRRQSRSRDRDRKRSHSRDWDRESRRSRRWQGGDRRSRSRSHSRGRSATWHHGTEPREEGELLDTDPQGGAEWGGGGGGFVWDEASGYYYDPVSQLYYDGHRGLYYSSVSCLWYAFDTATNKYVPHVEASEPDAGTEQVGEAAKGEQALGDAADGAATVKEEEVKEEEKKPTLAETMAAAAAAAQRAEKEKEKEREREKEASRRRAQEQMKLWKQRQAEAAAAAAAAATARQVAASTSASTGKGRGGSLGQARMSSVFSPLGAAPGSGAAVASKARSDAAPVFSSSVTTSGVVKPQAGGGSSAATGLLQAQSSIDDSQGLSGVRHMASMPGQASAATATPASGYRTEAAALGSYNPNSAAPKKRKFSEKPLSQQAPLPAGSVPVASALAGQGGGNGANLASGGGGVSVLSGGPLSSTGRGMLDGTPGMNGAGVAGLGRGAPGRGGEIFSTPFPLGVQGRQPLSSGGRGAPFGGPPAFRGAPPGAIGGPPSNPYEMYSGHQALDDRTRSSGMPRNMGWQEGSGLGHQGSGIVEPVNPIGMPDRMDLDLQAPHGSDPRQFVQPGDTYRTMMQKKAQARFADFQPY